MHSLNIPELSVPLPEDSDQMILKENEMLFSHLNQF